MAKVEIQSIILTLDDCTALFSIQPALASKHRIFVLRCLVSNTGPIFAGGTRNFMRMAELLTFQEMSAILTSPSTQILWPILMPNMMACSQVIQCWLLKAESALVTEEIIENLMRLVSYGRSFATDFIQTSLMLSSFAPLFINSPLLIERICDQLREHLCLRPENITKANRRRTILALVAVLKIIPLESALRTELCAQFKLESTIPLLVCTTSDLIALLQNPNETPCYLAIEERMMILNCLSHIPGRLAQIIRNPAELAQLEALLTSQEKEFVKARVPPFATTKAGPESWVTEEPEETDAKIPLIVYSIHDIRAHLALPAVGFTPSSSEKDQLCKAMLEKLKDPVFVGDWRNLQIVFEFLASVKSRLGSNFPEYSLLELASTCTRALVTTPAQVIHLIRAFNLNSVNYNRVFLDPATLDSMQPDPNFCSVGKNADYSDKKRQEKNESYRLQATLYFFLAIQTLLPHLFLDDPNAFAELWLTLIGQIFQPSDEVYNEQLLTHPTMMALGLLCFPARQVTAKIKESKRFSAMPDLTQHPGWERAINFQYDQLTRQVCHPMTLYQVEVSLKAQWPTLLATASVKRKRIVFDNFQSIIEVQTSESLLVWLIENLPLLITATPELHRTFAVYSTVLNKARTLRFSATNIERMQTGFLVSLISIKGLMHVEDLHAILSFTQDDHLHYLHEAVCSLIIDHKALATLFAIEPALPDWSSPLKNRTT